MHTQRSNAAPKPASSTELAAATLREKIFNGELAPGARLFEVKLAKSIGISRTPLHLAMLELEREGLIERKPTTGFIVRSLTFEDVADAIELRGMLEGMAARRAAERGMNDVQKAGLNAVLARLDLVIAGLPGELDMDSYAIANAEFHALIAASAKSRIIADEIAKAQNLPFSSPSAFLQTQRDDPTFQQSLIVAQSQHRAVVAAITAREGARAEAIMREHARIALNNLAFIKDTRPGLRDQIPGLSLVVQ